jgi:glycosyltransferase involved in cell wall biosynthesis
MNPRVSVLLPIYNEEGNLSNLFEELTSALAELPGGFEIIAVDDGSRDKSPQILAKWALEDPRIKVIVFRRNAGQTAAFDAGFRSACGEVIVTMDSDLQNDPRDIPKMIAMLDQGYDFISGWRKNRKDGFILRTFPSRIANWIIRKATKTKIHDLGCSLKVYRRELTDELRIYGEMHRFIAVLMEGLGARVGEVEVNHRARVAGESKYNLTRSYKVLIDLCTVWFLQGYRTKPSYIFGGIGGGLMGSSFLLCVFVLWEKYAQGVWVHRNPLFVIAMIFAVIAIQFFGLGLLAELLIRTYFESSARAPYSIARRIGFDRPQISPQWTTMRAAEPVHPGFPHKVNE